MAAQTASKNNKRKEEKQASTTQHNNIETIIITLLREIETIVHIVQYLPIKFCFIINCIKSLKMNTLINLVVQSGSEFNNINNLSE